MLLSCNIFYIRLILVELSILEMWFSMNQLIQLQVRTQLKIKFKSSNLYSQKLSRAATTEINQCKIISKMRILHCLNKALIRMLVLRISLEVLLIKFKIHIYLYWRFQSQILLKNLINLILYLISLMRISLMRAHSHLLDVEECHLNTCKKLKQRPGLQPSKCEKS